MKKNNLHSFFPNFTNILKRGEEQKKLNNQNNLIYFIKNRTAKNNFKKKTMHTSTSTALIEDNNVQIIHILKKHLHSFFPNFINIVKRGEEQYGIKEKVTDKRRHNWPNH